MESDTFEDLEKYVQSSQLIYFSFFPANWWNSGISRYHQCCLLKWCVQSFRLRSQETERKILHCSIHSVHRMVALHRTALAIKMCERSEDLDARLSDQSWGHVSEKWPSDYSTKGCVQMLCPNIMSLCPDIEGEQMLEKPESKLLLKTFSCERINLCISH